MIAQETRAGNCATGEVRLANAGEDLLTNTSTGTLEICINNAWGVVCNDEFFGIFDVEVACQQAGGYERESAGEIESVSITTPLLLSKLYCDGNEETLLDCTSSDLITGPICTSGLAPVITCKGQHDLVTLVCQFLFLSPSISLLRY